MSKHSASSLAPARGFSLIELMIAVAIVAVIAALAGPSYSQYIRKGKWKQAENDVVALTLSIENAYRRSLTYPASSTSTADLMNRFPGWTPVSKDNFDFKFVNTPAAAPNPQTLVITATGKLDLLGCKVEFKLREDSAPSHPGCKL